MVTLRHQLQVKLLRGFALIRSQMVINNYARGALLYSNLAGERWELLILQQGTPCRAFVSSKCSSPLCLFSPGVCERASSCSSCCAPHLTEA